MTNIAHAYTAQKNYTMSAQDRSKFRVSIAHSLRCISKMPTDTLDKIQWDDSLSHLNMFFNNTQVIPLNELTENEKVELIEKLVRPPVHDKRRKQTALANYARKMRNAIDKELAYGNVATSEALTNLLNTDASIPIDTSVTEQFNGAFRTRTKQRINMVSKFINAHNALINDDRCGSHTRYQEVIFKIPEKWEISSRQLTADIQFRLVKNFLKRLLPNHPILFATTHADENINKDHCAHIHVFIDGQNTQTGQFDLRKSELEALDKYVNEHNIDAEEWNKKKAKNTYAHSQERGKIWQKMFLNAINAFLIHQEIPIKIERAIQTDEYKEQLTEMRKQSQKRKSDRSHNFYTLYEEQKKLWEKDLSDLVQKVSKKQKYLESANEAEVAIEKLNDDQNTLKQHNSILNSKIKQSARYIEQQKKTFDKNNNQIKAQENKIANLQSTEEEIVETIKEFQPELSKLKTQQEDLETAKTVAANDISMHSVVMINKMISDYYKNIREKKPEDSGLFDRIIKAFKQLITKFQRKFVMDKVYDLSREADCHKLSKELHLINKTPPKKQLHNNNGLSMEYDH